MKTPIRPWALLLLSLSACSGAGTPPMRRALDEALARQSWRDLRIDAECHQNFQVLSTRLLGTGVGIWNDERQLTVPRERLLGLLGDLRRAGFGGRQDSREEEEREEREREERERREHRRGESEHKIEGLEGGESEEESNEQGPPCRLLLRLDGQTQTSDELPEKRRWGRVQDVAGKILDLGSELGSAGLTAASLEDGLDKIARGELAPETLTVQLQRQPDDPQSREGGWILLVEDAQAQISFFAPETGWTEPRKARLTQEEAAGLAQRLAAVRPSELPLNLYSTGYQDLQIGVLNRKTTLQSRQFARLTPETHGEKQQRFDQLVAALEEVKRSLAP